MHTLTNGTSAAVPALRPHIMTLLANDRKGGRTIKKIALSFVVIGSALVLLCTPGLADTIYILNDGNSAISGFAGPYGTRLTFI